MKIVAIIPAYDPPARLVDYVKALAASDWLAVVVVNDGSASRSDEVFKEIGRIPNAIVCEHAVNLGKGAALRTGLNYAYCQHRDAIGSVTIDADGQHLISDAVHVGRVLGEHPTDLVLGVRAFDADVPLRSRVGNGITGFLFRWVIGQSVSDTQTGLRGIPRDLVPTLLKLESRGYEFELDMLLACKHSGRRIRETKVQTVYLGQNDSSHFNPLWDSMRIYLVLFRFLLTSLATAAIDYSVFWLVYSHTTNLGASQIAARLVAMVFNYTAVKRLVFYSKQAHAQTLPKYASLVAISGTISYFMIRCLSFMHFMPVTVAKIVSEVLIFLANFTIQRDFIFTRGELPQQPQGAQPTDWDTYYRRPYRTAWFSRRITQRRLNYLARAYAGNGNRKIVVGELGGAGSCFCRGLCRHIPVSEYHIIDNNRTGLAASPRNLANCNTVVHYQNILEWKEQLNLDLSFSVGLIEHFSPQDTARAIAAHFHPLKPGGIAIISFPTPTRLYRMTRFLAEATGKWIFHDERPLHRQEVAVALKNHGEILHEELNWAICLTQRIMVIRKYA